MMTPFPPKTPMQMRREAGRANPVKQRPAGEVDPSSLPPLAAESPRELDATMEWLAHVQAGRIQVR